jgi:hypothetical protein
MWRALLTFALVLLLLFHTQPTANDFDPEIPLAAQRTILQDYLEGIHPPKLGGECEEMSVFKVSLIKPPGGDGICPVLWLKHAGKIGAVLDLTYSDLRYLGPRVWAQPVIVLRDVTILRLCHPSNGSESVLKFSFPLEKATFGACFAVKSLPVAYFQNTLSGEQDFQEE